jgi:hypothetical protein
MSYFGNSGPAQDGGFIAGIGAGANRLNNARAARARHAKALGYRPDVFTRGEGYSPANDAKLTEVAPVYAQVADNYWTSRGAYADGVITEQQLNQVKTQYLKDRKLIEQWAEAGPYVHEGKAIGGGLLIVAVGVAGLYLINNYRMPRFKPKASKGAWYGVFS